MNGWPGYLKKACLSPERRVHMKIRKIVMTLLLAIGLMIIPQLGTAEMASLSEDQMNGVVGQAGVSFQIDSLNWNMTIETLAYGDEDGLGPGTNTTAGYFSLCGIEFVGSAQFTDPLKVDISTTGNGTGLRSLNMTMTGMELKVDRFSIDAIRLGSTPGTGDSLGSIYMSNMVASITGNVRISTIP
jgi:hypothetical protein